ncbi:MAG: hypothetical protein CML02_08595 [Pseudooceanicola sp.]|nr:hypothetical protein [Pseudooceanicola sp.]
MTEITPLDTAHAAMEAAPADDAARLGFYARLADGELFLLLTTEPAGDKIDPETFEIADGTFVLAFDREERLAQFVGRTAPYVAMPGRVLAGMLAGQGIGLGVNLDVAPSATLLPPEAMAWLADTVANAPSEVEARIAAVIPPRGLPESLVTALDTKLATAGGLAKCAYLAGVEYDSGAKGHMLAFVDAVEAARPALAGAVGEALTFSGIEAGMLDVGFFAATDPMAASLARAGLRFDLPEPERPSPRTPSAPGSDPSKPPILR